MVKKVALLLILLVGFSWSQIEEDPSQANPDRLSRKKWEEEQRLDEYALSLRRRDWLKDRLILQVGFGNKYPVLGNTGFGYGVGAEYISRWHLAPFATYGIIPSQKDDAFEDDYTLDGGSGYKMGLAYYFFPKSPLHLSLAGSYGTVYFDHTQAQDTVTGARELIMAKGWELDMGITYLTNEWYYLTFTVGYYYFGDKLPMTSGREISFRKNLQNNDVSLVVDPDGMPEKGISFGAGIGFALPDMFPDQTEINRRKREAKSTR